MSRLSVRWMARSGAVACVLATAGSAGAAPAVAAPQAPGAPGAVHTWAPADKHGFATARQRANTAYLTLRQASASEVYYPDLSTPAFRSLQFAVVDGDRVDRETVEGDARHIEPAAPGVRASVEPDGLSFRQVTETARWRLTKTWSTDPDRASVLVRVRLQSRTGRALKLYVLADPAPGDDGDDDRAVSARGQLVAYDDDAASAVAATPALRETTSGYRGRSSEPWRQLRSTGRLRAYDATRRGNVVQGARTALTGTGSRRDMTLAIGFGPTRARAAATVRRTLDRGFASAAREYDAGWTRYLRSLREPPQSIAGPGRGAELRRVYDQSLLVLAALEDKIHRGASIASPSMPWVWATLTLEDRDVSGPYHLVWPRDFYHVATAQQAAGDEAAVGRLLDYLWKVQKADGSWWQNTRVDGEKYWTNEQMDQVALPIVLAWWTGRTGGRDWARVEEAADFLLDKGPQTGQERWENQSGWSPNTIATEIAGLICAADIARRNGEPGKAAAYEAVADEWQRRVEGWTATSTGPYDPKPYYLRITKRPARDDTRGPDPDARRLYSLGDNFPRDVDQREIVDPSFLGLVLFGVKPWNDPTILNSVRVVDGATGPRRIQANTLSGPIWRRFTFDGYGEQQDGGLWDIFDPGRRQTLGRAWPILTGERGEYELAAGRPADLHLQTIARTANDGLMLPEQAWDGRPPTGDREGGPSGEGTRSATPLAWTHAQFVRLAWSMDAGKPIERPSIVACRYAGVDC